MISSDYETASQLWSSFCDEVKYHHRYFPSHPVFDRLSSFVKECELSINPGSIYYRARIIDEKAARTEHMVAKCYGLDATEEDRKWYRNKANKFRGLTKEGSYVPPDPDMIRDARSNPKFIRYLYMAESPTTAVLEVRPILFNSVNVARIEVKQPLLIANIAVDIDVSSAKEKSLDEWLLSFIQSAFSSPTTNPDDYIPSQIIAEYIRYLGYDGIRYSSSLHEGGFNLTIFDTSKCEAVSSTDLRLDKITISMRPALGAQNIDNHFECIVDNIPKKLDIKSGRLVEAEE